MQKKRTRRYNSDSEIHGNPSQTIILRRPLFGAEDLSYPSAFPSVKFLVDIQH